MYTNLAKFLADKLENHPREGETTYTYLAWYKDEGCCGHEVYNLQDGELEEIIEKYLGEFVAQEK